ncbi:MAG: peptidase S24 [Robiginitomaculum sp.]|nr:MAG: peptidase S24 [Robiginitomaculum sp.]
MPEDFSVAVCALPVSAGFPSPAGDDLEDEIDPIAWIVRRPGSTFWWRVQGDCLEDVGIRHGDLIAVDRAGTKKLGRIVLAIIDGDITAKILARDKRGYWLRPANRKANYKDIPFTETTEVWGVVAGVVRRYEVE